MNNGLSVDFLIRNIDYMVETQGCAGFQLGDLILISGIL